MPTFGPTSLAKLAKADPRLRAIFEEVITHFDCSILNSIRTLEEQRDYVARGLSKTMDSKHLPADPSDPSATSRAVDAAPYPQRWDAAPAKAVSLFDLQLLYFSGYVKAVADLKGIPLRTGVDWNRNNDPSDETFRDWDHFELDEK